MSGQCFRDVSIYSSNQGLDLGLLCPKFCADLIPFSGDADRARARGGSTQRETGSCVNVRTHCTESAVKLCIKFFFLNLTRCDPSIITTLEMGYSIEHTVCSSTVPRKKRKGKGLHPGADGPLS